MLSAKTVKAKLYKMQSAVVFLFLRLRGKSFSPQPVPLQFLSPGRGVGWQGSGITITPSHACNAMSLLSLSLMPFCGSGNTDGSMFLRWKGEGRLVTGGRGACSADELFTYMLRRRRERMSTRQKAAGGIVPPSHSPFLPALSHAERVVTREVCLFLFLFLFCVKLSLSLHAFCFSSMKNACLSAFQKHCLEKACIFGISF